MSNQAIDLLIEYELLKSNGAPIDLNSLPSEELSKRYSCYVNARKSILTSEIDNYELSPCLNAQFSTWSSIVTKEKVLSSLLVYNKVVLNDPLISSRDNISLEKLIEGINFFSWLHPLIRAGFVSLFPINFYNNPSKNIPFFHSEDSFRSSIPKKLHDYAHNNVLLKSVILNDKGEMLILNEDADVNRRSAIHVGFKNDLLHSGVSLYLYQTIDGYQKNDDGSINVTPQWDKNQKLSKERFDLWSYQTVNQAMLARLKAIYDQSFLAEKLGNTYITESDFESKILSFSESDSANKISPAVKFLSINDSFVQIESPNQILELRNKFGSAFERFNASLLTVSDELQNISSDQFQIKSQRLLHSEILPQVDEYRDSIRQVQHGVVKGALVSIGGLALGIAAGTVLPLIPALMYSSASALTESLPAISSLQSNKKKPSYIWHRITKKT